MKSQKHAIIFLITLFAWTAVSSALYAENEEEGKKETTAAVEENTVAPDETMTDMPAAETPKTAEEAMPVPASGSAPEKMKEMPKESPLMKFPPQIKTSQWGPEIRINVIPDPQMGGEAVAAIQSVRLETEKGEYLGLKTFQPDEKSREAEFMINPEILKIDSVKITVSSKTGGQWSKVTPLETPKEGAEAKPAAVSAAPASATPAPQAAKPAPKKKGWFW